MVDQKPDGRGQMTEVKEFGMGNAEIFDFEP